MTAGGQTAGDETTGGVDLRGRTVLVTGASRGLGSALAVQLARCGADVAITYRVRADEAAAVADRVRALGRQAWVTSLDLEDAASVEALFDWAGTAFDRLDGVVLNAAATSFRPLLTAEARHLHRTFEISCVGFLRCVQLAAPMLQATGGTIVAVSGADTRTLIPAHGVLAAAKAAMEAMVRYLAAELGPLGVTIVGANPGTIMGESIRRMLGDAYAFAEDAERATHPLRTAATPDDIAAAIALLLTPAARWANGAVVDLDGGSVFAMCGRWMHEATAHRLLAAGVTDADLGPSVT